MASLAAEDRSLEVFCIDTGEIWPLTRQEPLKLEQRVVKECAESLLSCEIAFIGGKSEVGVRPQTEGCFVNGTSLEVGTGAGEPNEWSAIAPGAVVFVGGRRFQLRHARPKSGRKLPAPPPQQGGKKSHKKRSTRHQKARDLASSSMAKTSNIEEKDESINWEAANFAPSLPPRRESPPAASPTPSEPKEVLLQTMTSASSSSTPASETTSTGISRRPSSGTGIDGWVMDLFSVMVWDPLTAAEEVEELKAKEAEQSDQVAEIICHELILSNPATAAALIDRVFKAVQDGATTNKDAIGTFLHCWSNTEDGTVKFTAMYQLIQALLSVGMENVDTWLGALLLLQGRLASVPGVTVPHTMVGIVVGTLSASGEIPTLKLACKLLQQWSKRQVHMPNGTGEMLCVIIRLHSSENADILAMVCELLVLLATTYPEIYDARDALRQQTKPTLETAMAEFPDHAELQRRASAWLSKHIQHRKPGQGSNDSQRKKKKKQAESEKVMDFDSAAAITPQKQARKESNQPILKDSTTAKHDDVDGDISQDNMAAVSTTVADKGPVVSVMPKQQSGSPQASPRTRRSLPAVPAKKDSQRQPLSPLGKTQAAANGAATAGVTTSAEVTNSKALDSPGGKAENSESSVQAASCHGSRQPGNLPVAAAKVEAPSPSAVAASAVCGTADQNLSSSDTQDGSKASESPVASVEEAESSSNSPSETSDTVGERKKVDKKKESSPQPATPPSSPPVVQPTTDEVESKREPVDPTPAVTKDPTPGQEMKPKRPEILCSPATDETGISTDSAAQAETESGGLSSTEAARPSSDDYVLTPRRQRRRSEWNNPDLPPVSPLSPLSPSMQRTKLVDDDEAATQELQAEHEDVAMCLSQRTMGVRLARQKWEEGRLIMALGTASQLQDNADTAGYLDVISMLLKQIYRWPHELIVEAMTSLGALNLSILSPKHVEWACSLMTVLTERLMIPPENVDVSDGVASSEDVSSCLSTVLEATEEFFSRQDKVPDAESVWRPAWQAAHTLNKRLSLSEPP